MPNLFSQEHAELAQNLETKAGKFIFLETDVGRSVVQKVIGYNPTTEADLVRFARQLEKSPSLEAEVSHRTHLVMSEGLREMHLAFYQDTLVISARKRLQHRNQIVPLEKLHFKAIRNCVQLLGLSHRGPLLFTDTGTDGDRYDTYLLAQNPNGMSFWFHEEHEKLKNDPNSLEGLWGRINLLGARLGRGDYSSEHDFNQLFKQHAEDLILFAEKLQREVAFGKLRKEHEMAGKQAEKWIETLLEHLNEWGPSEGVSGSSIDELLRLYRVLGQVHEWNKK